MQANTYNLDRQTDRQTDRLSLLSRVNVADIWRERERTLSVEVSQRFH